MRALDTPVLVDLLRGHPAARALAADLGSEELATTEINLWELGVLAVEDRRPGRARRLESLELLRRKLTVLPIDEEAIAYALRHGGELAGSSGVGVSALLYATLLAHGVEEFLTVREGLPPRAPRGLRVVDYHSIYPKKRK